MGSKPAMVLKDCEVHSLTIRFSALMARMPVCAVPKCPPWVQLPLCSPSDVGRRRTPPGGPRSSPLTPC